MTRRLFALANGRFTMAPDEETAAQLAGCAAFAPTADDLRALLASAAPGILCRQFAVSRQTLANWRRRAGVEHKLLAERLTPDVVAAISAGGSIEGTARKLRCHTSTVRKIVRRNGLALTRQSRPLSLTAEQLLRLLPRCPAGRGLTATAEALAKKAKVSTATIYRRMKSRPDLAREVRAIATRDERVNGSTNAE